MESQGRTFTEAEVAEIVKIATHEATKTAIDVYQKRHEDYLKKKNEKAVKNAITLLDGYTAMKGHCQSAISRASESLVPSDLATVLYDVFNRKGLLQIEAILASKRRTELIVEHIDRMLDVYKRQCAEKGKPYYACMIKRFVNHEPVSEIAKELNTVEKTVYNWSERGVEELSVYLFGAWAL
ncbi:hypothetical protein [Veillonella caviae]|uniref:hypothetical protein n=1 Tax=Veillonella caviae TaxID=248316 RepID=UPI0023A7C851|nr:hypothetical protein [Veillonella caviae]MCI5708679.1 hypothetical protein [Veillonella caviae]MDY4746493.1 hypothetical protein [Veillonella caviae]MDY5716010.1 hypothetical protein [Veillonella caviae]